MICLYWFEALGVTAVDDGGPLVHLYAAGPGEALTAGSAQAVHVVGVWDHKAGRRSDTLSAPVAIKAAVTEWAQSLSR